VRLTAVVLLTALVAVPATARANTIDFAVGEQFVGKIAGEDTRTSPAYYTDARDEATLTPAVWRLLHARHARVFAHLRYGRDFGPAPQGIKRRADVLTVIRAANRAHVPVVAWPVVPYAEGYWANARNVASQRRAVDALLAWAKRRRVRLSGVQLDLEQAIQDAETVSALRTDPAGVIAMLNRNVGPSRQCAVAGDYQALVRSIRSRGLAVIASAYPFYLDDIDNGDLALSDGLGLPVALPGEFDQIGFMTMRSVYLQLLGSDPGSSLQADYAATVNHWFPNDGALILGVTGTAPYDRIENLIDDVRTVAAVNRRSIGMYSLEGLLHAFGFGALRRVLDAAASPLPPGSPELAPSSGSMQARTTLSTMDSLVGAGTPLATAGRGKPELPNRWPSPCG